MQKILTRKQAKQLKIGLSGMLAFAFLCGLSWLVIIAGYVLSR